MGKLGTTMADTFVEWFRAAAPYIHAFRGKTFVVAFGGDALADGGFSSLIYDFNLLNSLGVRLVLVHGVRPQVEERLAAQGDAPQYVGDLRVTDADTLELVKDAVGSVRVDIESMLSVGLPNTPMAGAEMRVASGNFVTARPVGVLEGVDLQFTGEVRKIADQAINARLAAGEIVLLSPLGYSPTGEVFNLALEEVATAAALARCIGAESVDLWKDVQGFMSADPKTVENPQVIHQLAYDEAAELSYFGARILHPRTFEPVLEKRIPIRIFNIDNVATDLTPVTVVVDQREIRKDVVKSVTFSDDFAILKLHGAGVGIKPGVMARVTSALHEAGINIKSIITAQTCINILLSRSDLKRSQDIVNHIGLIVVDEIAAVDDISLIAVVGDGILEKAGIAARVFSAVSQHDINIRTISAGASRVAIYFIVNREDCQKAVKSIHKEFFT